MKRQIPIQALTVGMFVEADVRSEVVDGQERYFLIARGAVYAEDRDNRRARLARNRHKQVTRAGGMLITEGHHIAALRAAGLSAVTIDTDMGDDAPDLPLPATSIGSARIRPSSALEEDETSTNAMDATDYERLILGEADHEATKTAAGPAGDSILELFDDEADTPEPGPQVVPEQPSSPSPTRARRRKFGPSAHGWMKIDIAVDGEQAILRVLSFGGDSSLGGDDIRRALEELYGLKAGFLENAIEELATRAAASPRRVIRGRFPVARMTYPQTAATEQVHYAFLDDIGPDTRLAYERLKTAFTLEDLEAGLAQKPLVRAVIPGEKLAVVAPADEGETVTDIFGRTRQVHGPQTLLREGTNVQVAGNCYLSQIYGYVCLLDGEISVISPVRISPDSVEAHFIHFPRAGSQSELVRPWLDQLLERAGVAYGIDEEALQQLVDHSLEGDEARAVRVACGRHSVPGGDTRIEYGFDPDKWACGHLPDGSVDFRERNAFIAVEEGQLLAEIHPATRGRPGIDLRGEEIPAGDGQKRDFYPGANVRAEYEGRQPKRFYARVDGNIRVSRNTVHVHELVTIHGDVDYSLGHIEAGKDVYITGSVRSGFEVQAGGSIAIGGSVETGVSINARGDVIVALGIVGSNTRIVALGRVQTKYVHNSSVLARGDIQIGSYLLNARVQAGGELVVRSGGSQRGGSIVGGQAVAAAGIKAVCVGSASGNRTVVGIGPLADVAARMQKLDRVIESYQTHVVRAFRTLGLHDIDVSHFKELIERTPRAQREPIMEVLRYLKKLARTREKALQMRQELERQSTEGIEKAEIEILGTVFSDVEIHMGDQQRRLDDNLSHTTFSLVDGDIEWRPLR